MRSFSGCFEALRSTTSTCSDHLLRLDKPCVNVSLATCIYILLWRHLPHLLSLFLSHLPHPPPPKTSMGDTNPYLPRQDYSDCFLTSQILICPSLYVVHSGKKWVCQRNLTTQSYKDA